MVDFQVRFAHRSWFQGTKLVKTEVIPWLKPLGGPVPFDCDQEWTEMTLAFLCSNIKD